MDLLDIYLMRSGKRRDHVIAETGLAKDSLYPGKPEKPSDLSREALKAIGETVGKTPEMVRQDLITIEKHDRYVVAHESHELLEFIKNKEAHIIIQGDFIETFNEEFQHPLTEKDQMGLDIGSRGFSRLWGEVFYQIGNLFKEKSEKQQIESKIRKYTLKQFSPNEVLLYLRQLEY